jgi:hypothetical protein
VELPSQGFVRSQFNPEPIDVHRPVSLIETVSSRRTLLQVVVERTIGCTYRRQLPCGIEAITRRRLDLLSTLPRLVVGGCGCDRPAGLVGSGGAAGGADGAHVAGIFLALLLLRPLRAICVAVDTSACVHVCEVSQAQNLVLDLVSIRLNTCCVVLATVLTTNNNDWYLLVSRGCKTHVQPSPQPATTAGCVSACHTLRTVPLGSGREDSQHWLTAMARLFEMVGHASSMRVALVRSKPSTRGALAIAQACMHVMMPPPAIDIPSQPVSQPDDKRMQTSRW